MQEKDFTQPIRITATMIIAAIVLGGCIEEEEAFIADVTAESSAAASSNGPPIISGNPTAVVKAGETYSFAPDASDPDSDPLTFAIENKPSWANFDTGTGKLSGQPSSGDVGVYSNILISVRDIESSAFLPEFSISVDQVGTVSTTLSWAAPTQNADGSPLLDLAGYNIYWGTTPGNYTDSATINNPGLTTYVVDNLTPGTYEFVATSFNVDGVESDYSSPVTKVL